MRITQLGGETALIRRITRKISDKDVVKGIGDDTAVVKIGNKYLLYTTDMIVEDDHFSMRYFAPEQIGRKAMEANVSDIAAMGGKPRYALVSLCLRKESTVGFVDGLYKGMYAAAKHYGFSIIGGDTVHGSQIAVNITMVGEVSKEMLCLRSDAKVGDFIMVTGDLGKSWAGLELFRKGLRGEACKFHVEPRCRLDAALKIARYVNAMEDISDGLAAEVRHICEESSVGAILFADNVPISSVTRETGQRLSKDPLDWALYGGEDFELVFTVSAKNLHKVKGYLVGEMVKGKGVTIYGNGRMQAAKKGFDHFA